MALDSDAAALDAGGLGTEARHGLRRARSTHDHDRRLPRPDRGFGGERACAPDEESSASGSREKAPTPITTASPTTSTLPQRAGGQARARPERRLPEAARQRRRRHPRSVDKCPDTPEDKDGIEDGDGCPEDDADKDGIPDVQDACPREPGQPAHRSEGERMPAVHQARRRLDRDRDHEADPVRDRQGHDQQTASRSPTRS